MEYHEEKYAKSWGGAMARAADTGKFIKYSDWYDKDYSTECLDYGVLKIPEITAETNLNYFVRVGSGWQGFRYLVNARKFSLDS